MHGIKDVAQKAGVSISTVSNVLNKTKYVSPELVRKVEAAVEELSYEVNPIARSMKSNRSGTIGIITEDICGVFYPYIIKGIASITERAGYHMVICDTRGEYGDRDAAKREQDIFKNLISSRVDGIIFVSLVSGEDREKYLSKLTKASQRYKPIPLVSMERDFTQFGIDSVYFDAYENSQKAVQHLVDCGCRKIVHISGPEIMEVAEERVQGYLTSMEKNDLPVDKNTMIVRGDYSHQSGYRGMKALLDNVPGLDGVFCANDQMAVGALKLLREYGKKIPDEVKLIGYDDVFISSVVEPAISTIHIRKRHAGIEAAKLLMERIDNPGEKRATVGIKMDSRLVVRKSTVADAPEDWILADW